MMLFGIVSLYLWFSIFATIMIVAWIDESVTINSLALISMVLFWPVWFVFIILYKIVKWLFKDKEDV